MKYLQINTTNKNEAIKQINKFRRLNKDIWFTCEIIPTKITEKDNTSFLINPDNEIKYTYHFKIFNTYIQIARKYKKNKGLIFKDSSPMDMNVTNFKKYLNEIIE